MIQKIFINKSCNISEYRSLYNNKCYADIGLCEPGTFGNNSTMKCELCPDGFYADNHISCLEFINFIFSIILGVTNCTTCTSNIVCQICNNGYFLSGSSCPPCDSGFYSNGTICTACLFQCLTCTTNTSCQNCKSGYYLNLSSCLSCDNSCKTCNSEEKNACTSCNPGEFWENYKCYIKYK